MAVDGWEDLLRTCLADTADLAETIATCRTRRTRRTYLILSQDSDFDGFEQNDLLS